MEYKFNLQGNYYSGQYHQILSKNADGEIKRKSPADLNVDLWAMPILYSDVERVVDSAVVGFSTYRKMHIDSRIALLKNYQAEVTKIKDELAEIISWEMGKPLWEAKTEVASVIQKVNVTIDDSLNRIQNKIIKNIMPNTDGHIIFKPIGPSLIIGPFNFPCHLANGQITSALIAGNSIIFKPSEKTAKAAEMLIDCFHRAGYPSGVINLIQGDGEIARRLLREKSIRAVFFTGSKDVGQKILSVTNQDLSKLVALELGGKNTTILHQDANPKHALLEIIKASFLTTGQRCTSTAIVAIHESLVSSFIPKFHDLAKKLIIDHPIHYKKEPFMGPLVDQASVDAYLLFMGMAKREGFEEVMRGKILERATKGHYVTPSIHYTPSFKDQGLFLPSEIFGPNVTFVAYQNIEDAIQIANKSEYGLAASIFTKDMGIYQECLENIDTGLVNLNRSTVGASARLPFGGVKNSGNYRPAAVTTIDACVYQMASLQVLSDEEESMDSIIGIGLDADKN